MGGGGFSMEPENPLLDRFVLSLARSADAAAYRVERAATGVREHRLPTRYLG